MLFVMLSPSSVQSSWKSYDRANYLLCRFPSRMEHEEALPNGFCSLSFDQSNDWEELIVSRIVECTKRYFASIDKPADATKEDFRKFVCEELYEESPGGPGPSRDDFSLLAQWLTERKFYSAIWENPDLVERAVDFGLVRQQCLVQSLKKRDIEYVKQGGEYGLFPYRYILYAGIFAVTTFPFLMIAYSQRERLNFSMETAAFFVPPMALAIIDVASQAESLTNNIYRETFETIAKEKEKEGSNFDWEALKLTKDLDGAKHFIKALYDPEQADEAEERISILTEKWEALQPISRITKRICQIARKIFNFSLVCIRYVTDRIFCRPVLEKMEEPEEVLYVTASLPRA